VAPPSTRRRTSMIGRGSSSASTTSRPSRGVSQCAPGARPPPPDHPRRRPTRRRALTSRWTAEVTWCSRATAARRLRDVACRWPSVVVSRLNFCPARRLKSRTSLTATSSPSSRHLLVMVALCNRGPLYFCPVVSIFYLLFFPRLISAVGDWMSTILPHMVCP